MKLAPMLSSLALAVAAPAISHAATFDPDSLADVFVVTDGGTVQWFEATGANNAVGYVKNITSSATSVAAGNFDPDALSDLFVGKAASTSWYESTGADNGHGFVSNPLGGTLSNGLDMGEFDGDGQADLVRVADDGAVVQYEATASNNSIAYIRNLTSNGLAATFGDLDGDGFTDLFVTKDTTTTWYESDGTNNGITFRSNISVTNAADVVVGDFDGDADNDLFVVLETGVIRWYESAGDNAAPAFVTDFDAGVSSIALGDIDGDNVNELLVGHASSGVSWYEAGAGNQVVLQSGATSFATSGVLDIAILVPEPGSLALLSLGGLLVMCRKSRRTA